MRNLAVTLVLTAAWGATTAAAAPVNRSWDVLMQNLKPREKVVVNRMNTGTVEGKLIEISAEAITVRWHGQPERIAREDVFRVRIADVRKHRTLIGMTIGAAAGAVILATKGNCTGCAGEVALLGAGLGAGFGALGGAVIPNRAPLYQAEPRLPSRSRPPASK